MYVTTTRTGGWLLEVTGGCDINPSPLSFHKAVVGVVIFRLVLAIFLSLPDRWELLAQIWRPTLLPSEPFAVEPVSIAAPPPPHLCHNPFSVVAQPESPAAAAARPVCIPNTDRPGLSQFWKIINVSTWLIADACRSVALLIKAALYFSPTLVMCASAMSVWSEIG